MNTAYTISICYGSLSPPLEVQLADFTLSDDQKEMLLGFDSDSKAITRLYVRGLLTESQKLKARKTLTKKIYRMLWQQNDIGAKQ